MENIPASSRGVSPIARYAIGFLAATALWGTATWWINTHGWPSKTAASPLVQTASNGGNQAFDAMIAEELRSLGVTPKTVTVASDEAYETLAAIKRGDYEVATQICRKVLARSQLGKWHFAPFNDFINSVTHTGTDPVLIDHLNVWVGQQSKSAVAYLIRAVYYHRAALAARGDGVTEVNRAKQAFDHDLDLAEADLQKSISLDPSNPWSFFLLLDVVSSHGTDGQIERTFQRAKRAYPDYYAFYDRRLAALTPNVGGSIDAMYSFVKQYAGAAKDDDPIQMLNLQLYAYLVDAAATDCSSSQHESRTRCMGAELQASAKPTLAAGMLKALNLYKVSDPIEFSNAIWPILKSMTTCGCEATALGAALQTAAGIMGSDNRLSDEPGHNNYVLDDITAHIWWRMGNNSNADQKFKEALKDVEHTAFPDEATKDQAMAQVYDDMAEMAHQNHQYTNIIVYHDAANAYGGHNHGDSPHYKCFAYFELKRLKAAVNECTALIDGNSGYLQTYYYRAMTYEQLGQWDASLADFAPIANSANNYFRVGAALDMTFDYGQKRDFLGELASFKEHEYVFDPTLQPPHDLAVAYNNRCHAYMELNRLKEALSDCTTSLKFDQIPDAYHKQQQLLKRIGSDKSSTQL